MARLAWQVPCPELNGKDCRHAAEQLCLVWSSIVTDGVCAAAAAAAASRQQRQLKWVLREFTAVVEAHQVQTLLPWSFGIQVLLRLVA